MLLLSMFSLVSLVILEAECFDYLLIYQWKNIKDKYIIFDVIELIIHKMLSRCCNLVLMQLHLADYQKVLCYVHNLHILCFG